MKTAPTAASRRVARRLARANWCSLACSDRNSGRLVATAGSAPPVPCHTEDDPCDDAHRRRVVAGPTLGTGRGSRSHPLGRLLERFPGLGQTLAARLTGLVVEPPVGPAVVDQHQLRVHGVIMTRGCDSYSGGADLSRALSASGRYPLYCPLLSPAATGRSGLGIAYRL